MGRHSRNFEANQRVLDMASSEMGTVVHVMADGDSLDGRTVLVLLDGAMAQRVWRSPEELAHI